MAHLREDLSAELVHGWQQSLKDTSVEVSIPKFEMRIKYDLKKGLIPLGIVDLFEYADLEGMMNGNMTMSKATHDAYVNVN